MIADMSCTDIIMYAEASYSYFMVTTVPQATPAAISEEGDAEMGPAKQATPVDVRAVDTGMAEEPQLPAEEVLHSQASCWTSPQDSCLCRPGSLAIS